MTAVDILIPYYGDEELLRVAVSSVLEQDDPRWRLTVVDDCDVPGVADWFAGLGDDRVRYLRNPENLGVTGNFNRCLELIEQELVVLMGCDDRLLSNYVCTVLAAHEAVPEAGIIQPGVRLIDGEGHPTRTLVDEAKRRVYAPKVRGKLLMSGEQLALSLVRGDWLYFPSLCWTASSLKQVRFREDLRVIQDLALMLELVIRGESLLVDETVCFEYRRHAASESSATAQSGSRFVEAGRFFAETAERLREHGWTRAARAARRHVSSRLFALTLLPGTLLARERESAKALARHAFGPGTDPTGSRRTPTAADFRRGCSRISDDRHGNVPAVTTPGSTDGADYTDRLKQLEQPLWKRVLDVQAPYRWNVRRLFGEREVLDVGCGLGRNLAHLAPRGIGVDHNEHSIEVCRERGLTAFTTAEFGESEYASPGRFGGLLAAHLIEHMPRDQAVEVLAGYLDYLAPGARVVFICPQERGYATDSTHVQYTDFDGLADVAERLGLVVERRISFPLPRAAGKLFPYNEFVLITHRP
ncbi:glycosyltransferase [Amycolatopsis sp.]|uniref:glycosyltransferase n=1 Tax=Amycolatopsis sp. TaxID=37632 RepID=UPI002CCB1FF7|nr:glycosyltransferase [Amycolatopsis sp.]HVV14492.1 glycosyltransferase [Amycolatopsis sp.]